MITNETSDSVHTTVAEHLESDHPVTLDELQQFVIQEHINEWSHEDCYNVLDSDNPRLDWIELGEYDSLPQCIQTISGTDVERRLRYHVAIEVVEQVLDTYEDPVVNHDLRLHS